MKKIYSLILLVFTFFVFTGLESYSEINKQINANIKTKRVPSGTVLRLKMLDSVGSSASSLGDQFDMMVTENIKVDNVVVIPQGSVIRGSIEEVRTPKMLYKGGLIRLYFDHIVSSTGKQVSVYAGICNNKNITYDGALSSKTTYSTALSKTAQTTKNIVVKPTSWAWEKGENMLNGAPKYVLSPITAIVCSPAAALYFAGDSIADVFKKGSNIQINQGEIIQVQLLKPLDMPVY
ncbi:MAG: hypothetical protein LUH11_02830 [Candidatus Gastranaerophilales bacterium]|nr:hypothetical protein [Candidatus Gastranaerophilales bacterium]